MITVAILGEIMSLRALPSLARLRHIPKASPNSFAPNHRAIKANCVVLRLSPPNPKIIRPRIIKYIDLLEQPSENRSCPIKTKKPKMRNIDL